jgi:hypothetical protein
MEQDHEQRIERISDQKPRLEGLGGNEQPFHYLCKARDLGFDSYLECLEERPFDCSFSFRYGYSYYCRCHLRVQVAKRFKL